MGLVLDKTLEGGGGSGASAFIALTDAPSSYVGQAGKVVRVNVAENAVEFATVAGTGDVVGPASATTNAITLFDGASGKLIKNSVVTVNVSGEITSPSLTASRALVSGASKEIQSSSVTATELGYVSGVTSALQTQLNDRVKGTVRITVSTTAPASPATGDLWVDTN